MNDSIKRGILRKLREKTAAIPAMPADSSGLIALGALSTAVTGGSLLGNLAGRGLANVTSPTGADIDLAKKRELVSALDGNIREVESRIQNKIIAAEQQ